MFYHAFGRLLRRLNWHGAPMESNEKKHGCLKVQQHLNHTAPFERDGDVMCKLSLQKWPRVGRYRSGSTVAEVHGSLRHGRRCG